MIEPEGSLGSLLRIRAPRLGAAVIHALAPRAADLWLRTVHRQNYNPRDKKINSYLRPATPWSWRKESAGCPLALGHSQNIEGLDEAELAWLVCVCPGKWTKRNHRDKSAAAKPGHMSASPVRHKSQAGCAAAVTLRMCPW